MISRQELAIKWCGAIVEHITEERRWYTVSCVVILYPHAGVSYSYAQVEQAFCLRMLYAENTVLYDLHSAPVPFAPMQGLTLLNIDLTPFGNRVPRFFADMETV